MHMIPLQYHVLGADKIRYITIEFAMDRELSGI
jgi:hypothetical protein